MGDASRAQQTLSQLDWQASTEWQGQGPKALQQWDFALYSPLPQHELASALSSLRVALPNLPILTLCDSEEQSLNALGGGSDETLLLADLDAQNLRACARRIMARNNARSGQNQRERDAHNLNQSILHRIASVLAHEINNPLAALFSFTDLCQDLSLIDADPSAQGAAIDELLELLPMVREAGQRIHDLARDTQSLAENSSLSDAGQDLSQILHASVTLSAGRKAAAISLDQVAQNTDSPLSSPLCATAPAGLGYCLLALFDQSLKAFGHDASAKIQLRSEVIGGQANVHLRASAKSAYSLDSLELLWQQLRGERAASPQVASLSRQLEQHGLSLNLQRSADSLNAQLRFAVVVNPADSLQRGHSKRGQDLQIELAA